MQRFVQGFIILLALAAPPASFAQEASEVRELAPAERQATGRDKDAGLEQGLAALVPETCFASGSGATLLKVCITVNGNISWLESPAGVVHIRNREGYAVCSFSSVNTVYGFDANVASDGWGPATVSDNKRIITRTSLDGMIQIKQTFTIIPQARGVDVKMEIKNLSPLLIEGVVVSRYFDGDIDDQQVNQYFHTGESVWGTKQRGLLLTGAPSPSVEFSPKATTFSEWDPLGGGSQFARGCSANLAFSGATGDYVGGLSMSLHSLKAGQTKSVILHYRRF